jgi:hypothetical protein
VSATLCHIERNGVAHGPSGVAPVVAKTSNSPVAGLDVVGEEAEDTFRVA